MDLSMAATLAGARAVRFSETARPRPCHREAGRRRTDGRTPAIRRRRLVEDRPERPAERPEAGEPDLEADVAHRAIRLAQQEHRALDPPALEVAVRRLAERRPERPDEVRLRDVGEPRERRDVEWLRVRAVHRVPRPEHPAVSLLDGAAHTGHHTTPASRAGTKEAPTVRGLREWSQPGSNRRPPACH